MRNRIILITTSLILLAQINVFGQTTTEEEYTYVTKGYKVQAANGLDMKKGYSIKDYGTWKYAIGGVDRGFDFKGLYRGNDTKPCAIMAIYNVYKKDGSVSYTEYYCIPVGDSEILWGKVSSQLDEKHDKAESYEMYQSMTYSLMGLASELSQK